MKCGILLNSLFLILLGAAPAWSHTEIYPLSEQEHFSYASQFGNLILDLSSDVFGEDHFYGGAYRMTTPGGSGGLLTRVYIDAPGGIHRYKFFDTVGAERCVGRLQVTFNRYRYINGNPTIDAKWAIDGSAKGARCSSVGKTYVTEGMVAVER